jgi:hypothetical protein
VFLDYTPVSSTSFDLLDWTTLLGDPNLANHLDLTSSTLSGGLTWDTSQFNSTGIISVTPEPSRVVLLAAGILGVVLRRRRPSRLD